MSKTSLDFRSFPATSIKNMKNWRFLSFTLSGPLSKQTVIVCNCDLCLMDYDPALYVFLDSLLSNFSARSRVFESFTSALSFLSSLY